MIKEMEDALNECMKECNKVLTKLHKDKSALIQANNVAMSLVHINYKDFELYSINDIQDLYGNGYITENRYNMLIEELNKKRAEATLEYKIDKLEYKIKYYKFFLNSLYGTLESEKGKE